MRLAHKGVFFLAAVFLALGLAALCLDSALAETKREEKSREHKEACQKWCNENKPECAYCSKLSDCGNPKHEKMKSWTGRGKNYYACRKKTTRDEAGEQHKKECNEWCDKNKPECAYCSKLSDCGNPKHEKMKSWTGRGKNYYACRKKLTREELGQAHREACEKWCKENPDKCDHCRSTATCGGNAKKVMTFGGKGKNWYACQKNK